MRGAPALEVKVDVTLQVSAAAGRGSPGAHLAGVAEVEVEVSDRAPLLRVRLADVPIEKVGEDDYKVDEVYMRPTDYSAMK